MCAGDGTTGPWGEGDGVGSRGDDDSSIEGDNDTPDNLGDELAPLDEDDDSVDPDDEIQGVEIPEIPDGFAFKRQSPLVLTVRYCSVECSSGWPWGGLVG
ncbi:unnamed protein product [Pylaiella littoralis]